MCQFQQLYHDASGYVIRCQECQHYQLLFNQTVLSLTDEEFQTFLTLAETYRRRDEPSVKDTVMPTPCKGVYMVLSDEKLDQLAHMLQSADSECKALSMLQLFA